MWDEAFRAREEALRAGEEVFKCRDEVEGLNVEASIAKANACRMRDEAATFRDEVEHVRANMVAVRYNDKLHECTTQVLTILQAVQRTIVVEVMAVISTTSLSVAPYNPFLQPHLQWRKSNLWTSV